MNPFSLMAALSTALVLPCRAFGPLFIVCAIATWPKLVAWMPGSVAPVFSGSLAWMATPGCVLAVGILALLETLASTVDDRDVKRVFNQVMRLVKTGVAVVVVLGVLPPDAAAQLQRVQVSGWTGTAVVAGGVALATWFLAGLRSWLWELWSELDEDDDFGLHLPLTLAEEGWALIAAVAAVAFPLLAFACALFLLGAVLVLRGVLRWWVDRKRVPCETCGHALLPSAARCPACKSARAPTVLRDFALLRRRRAPQGSPSDEQVADHRMRLLSQGRCPTCAERQHADRLLEGGCPACGATLSEALGPAWFEPYRARVVGRAWRLFVPVLLCGLIPSVGVAVSLVVARVMVVAPLRFFLGRGGRLGMRWFMRVVAFLVFLLGSLPVLSLFCAPALLLLYLQFYGVAARRAVREFQGEPVRAPA